VCCSFLQLSVTLIFFSCTFSSLCWRRCRHERSEEHAKVFISSYLYLRSGCSTSEIQSCCFSISVDGPFGTSSSVSKSFKTKLQHFLPTVFSYLGLFQIYDMYVHWSRNWRYSICIYFKIHLVRNIAILHRAIYATVYGDKLGALWSSRPSV
jgi:hypothetical protein